jgi:hypothetical protein
MDGDDRVKPGALPAAYEQLLVVELLEVAVDQLLVTVNTAALPEPPEARFESLEVAVPELLLALEPPDPVEPAAVPVVPPDVPAVPVEVVVPELPGPLVPLAARSVVVPVAAGTAVVVDPDAEAGAVGAAADEPGVVATGVAGVPVLIDELAGSSEL